LVEIKMFPRLIFRILVLAISVGTLVGLPASTFVEKAQGIQFDCSPNTTIVHSVARGENLFRIAVRYNTTVAAVSAANGITNPQLIYVGQRLVIPCGAANGAINPPVLVPVYTGSGCGSFSLTSPLDGLPFGGVTFFWDSAPGATSYQLNIYQERDEGFINGPLLASYVIPAPRTDISVDVGWPLSAHGIWFSWQVHAFSGGQVICSSPRWSIWRGPAPDFPPPGTVSDSTPSPICGDNICEPLEDGFITCQTSNDCPQGVACINNFCAVPFACCQDCQGCG
jgi:hypothetical protein